MIKLCDSKKRYSPKKELTEVKLLPISAVLGLVNDNERKRRIAITAYGMDHKICPIWQSWGEANPISFELNFK